MGKKVLFIGGTPRGLELLKEMLSQEIKVVFSFIMKEDEHELNSASADLQKLCIEHKIPFKICKRIQEDHYQEIKKYLADVGVVCGWRTIIPAEVFNAIPEGLWAAHDSLLPRYRGFCPLNWAIINGEKQSGVTLFKITGGDVDSGPIFKQSVVDIGEKDSIVDVYSRVIQATKDLYLEFFKELEKGGVKLKKQDESKATYVCKRVPDDGQIDWSKSSIEVFNLIRALTPPYSGAFTYLNGKKLFVLNASLPEKELIYEGNIPGRIAFIRGSSVCVLCGKGQIMLHQVGESLDCAQPASERLNSTQLTCC